MIQAVGDPNLAFLLLLTGLLALSWEFHAPGLFLPGILGVILLCMGAFGLWENAPTWYGSLMLLAALVFLAVELKVSHAISGIVGALLLAVGAMRLIRGPHPISPTLAIASASAVCAIAIFLGILGFRARGTARLTGVDKLIGQIGVSRTGIGSAGTVFVQGEYWQATSDLPIPQGARVLVERVQGMTLVVKEAQTA